MTEVTTASWTALWQANKLGPLPVQVVRISRGLPRFWPAAGNFPAVESLMPDPWMLGIDDPEKFGRTYRRKLHTIGLAAIQTELDALAATDPRPIAVACFEKDPADCHRGPLGFAGWYLAKTGTAIPEWQLDPAQLQLDQRGDAAEGQDR